MRKLNVVWLVWKEQIGNLVLDGTFFAGVGLVMVGIYMIYPPAAYIFLGTTLVAIALLKG